MIVTWWVHHVKKWTPKTTFDMVDKPQKNISCIAAVISVFGAATLAKHTLNFATAHVAPNSNPAMVQTITEKKKLHGGKDSLVRTFPPIIGFKKVAQIITDLQ